MSKYPSSVAAILKPRFRDRVTPIFQPTPISERARNPVGPRPANRALVSRATYLDLILIIIARLPGDIATMRGARLPALMAPIQGCRVCWGDGVLETIPLWNSVYMSWQNLANDMLQTILLVNKNLITPVVTYHILSDSEDQRLRNWAACYRNTCNRL